MKLAARIHWRTLLTALGIGLVVEALLVRLYYGICRAYWQLRKMVIRLWLGKRYD
jgi:hypothetical protein